MPRKKSGSIWRKSDGTLKARITVTDVYGKTRRPWFDIDPKFDDAAAMRIAEKMSSSMDGVPWDKTAALVARKAGGVLTCAEYYKLFRASRVGKIKTVKIDDGRWKKHLAPLVGNVPVDELNPELLRDVVESLDRKAKSPEHRKGRDRFGAKTACNVWSLFTGMLDEMVNSKFRELRVLKVDPAKDVKPPDPPDRVSKQWLFPVELRRLLACKDVPLSRRRLYAVAVYCYARPGEVLGFLWGRGIDIKHGMVRVNRAYDSREGRFFEHTKSHDSRHFGLEPVLRPLLERMHQRRRTELVFETVGHLSENLRRDLLTAGVERAELHKPRGVGELPIRFHDLRATGITYMAIRGDRDNDIRERAGHADFATTQIYIRRGHLASGEIGDPFAPLPPELLGESSTDSSPGGGAGGVLLGKNAEREKGFEPSAGSLQVAEPTRIRGVTDHGDVTPEPGETFETIRRRFAELAERMRAAADLVEIGNAEAAIIVASAVLAELRPTCVALDEPRHEQAAQSKERRHG